ncbi:nucleoside phosphorylase domain-containing protein [Aspergillus oleicola]
MPRLKLPRFYLAFTLPHRLNKPLLVLEEADDITGSSGSSSTVTEIDAEAGYETETVDQTQRVGVLSGSRDSQRMFFVTKLITPGIKRQVLQSSTSECLDKLLEQPELSNSSYPGSAQDELFPPDYPHEHRMSTQRNGSLPQSAPVRQTAFTKAKTVGKAIQSHERPSPKVHIGTVGSGDMVTKSSRHRDEIAQKHGLIAFEMEAAGLCDTFPSLVIKGVCDYADSHKNKVWQDYAACTAAACMKAFLEEWSG